MVVLGIDTSTMVTSVALVGVDADGSPRMVGEAEDPPSARADSVLAVIDRVLSSASVSLAELSGIAVGAGPGSFTGLRIGMATAKGLAFAAELPLWAVSSLAALASSAVPGGARVPVAAVIDARRGEVYCGCYLVGDGRADPLCDERVLAPGALVDMLAQVAARARLERFVMVGDGLSAYESQLQHIDRVGDLAIHASPTPRGAAVARLACHGELPDALVAGGPVYVRKSEAELKFPDGNPGGTFSPRR